MTSNVTSPQILKLYKALIRESKKFPAYNYRNYALRRIRDSFKEYKDLKDINTIQNHFQEGIRNLEMIKRQVLVGQLYSTEKLVIENFKTET